MEQAQQKDSRELTNTQIATLLIPNVQECLTKKGALSAKKIRAYLEVDCKIRIGNNRSYDVEEVLKRFLPEYA
jgi:hypothetical protein